MTKDGLKGETTCSICGDYDWRALVVHGFYEEGWPQFAQGREGENEITEPVTAEELNGMITKMTAMVIFIQAFLPDEMLLKVWEAYFSGEGEAPVLRDDGVLALRNQDPFVMMCMLSNFFQQEVGDNEE